MFASIKEVVSVNQMCMWLIFPSVISEFNWILNPEL